MPFINRLTINDFRNLAKIDIEPSDGVNFIVGANGAGKSSLLEAITVAGRGRSLRSSRIKSVVQHGQSQYTVFVAVSNGLNGLNGVNTSLGVERKIRGTSRIRVDGLSVSSSAVLAKNLPLLVLDASSFSLLDGGPKERRKFFDWLVFHVKHEFAGLWKDLSRCVHHRNTLLRRDRIEYSDLKPWDIELAKIGSLVAELRSECFELFRQSLATVMSANHNRGFGELELELYQGWKTESGLELQLESAFQRDRKLGYTTLGPHKAQISFFSDGLPVVDFLSRGQKKALIAASFIAKARVFCDLTRVKPIVLIDDLPAELDDYHQRFLASCVSDLGCQVFVTGVEDHPLRVAWNDCHQEVKMFHVKHGEIKETLASESQSTQTKTPM
ncbi:MAG: DNA replication and repair protein RecF [Lentisphaeria bacterium]|jgi:DNA replication and repair protein RecF